MLSRKVRLRVPFSEEWGEKGGNFDNLIAKFCYKLMLLAVVVTFFSILLGKNAKNSLMIVESLF